MVPVGLRWGWLPFAVTAASLQRQIYASALGSQSGFQASWGAIPPLLLSGVLPFKEKMHQDAALVGHFTSGAWNSSWFISLQTRPRFVPKSIELLNATEQIMTSLIETATRGRHVEAVFGYQWIALLFCFSETSFVKLNKKSESRVNISLTILQNADLVL